MKNKIFKTTASKSPEYAVLETLLYADIFSYPLTEKEIYTYLIGHATKEEIHSVLQTSRFLETHQTYYFLTGRKDIVSLRKKRFKISNQKLKKAQKISKILSFIPSIRFLGVSGSLSMYNADVYDDIDFFVITAPHMLWITRLITTGMLFFTGNKRSPNESHGVDKICLNMWMTEDSLLLSKSSRNVFTAHEVAQVLPLINRNDVYNRFLALNAWVQDYLPHTNIPSVAKKVFHTKGTTIVSRIISHIDSVCFVIQKWYMRKRRKEEIVRKDIATFHPKDKTLPVLSFYSLRRAHLHDKIKNQAQKKAMKSKLFTN